MNNGKRAGLRRGVVAAGTSRTLEISATLENIGRSIAYMIYHSFFVSPIFTNLVGLRRRSYSGLEAVELQRLGELAPARPAAFATKLKSRWKTWRVSYLL